MNVNPDYFEQPREELLKFLPSRARSALDVGCGAGTFALELKRRYQAEVWGIELAVAPAGRAERVLDRVLCGDVHALVQTLPLEYFDLVTCNDVLEHLTNPYQVLGRLRDSLRSDGCVVCSIPNIRYYPALRRILIEKDFRYESDGVFDVTHLRFFTHKSIVRMFVQLGFELERIEGINPLERLQPALVAEYERSCRLFPGWLDDARYQQFACVAHKKIAGVNPSPSEPQEVPQTR